LLDRRSVVTQAAEKAQTGQAHQALAVDMETLAVAQVSGGKSPLSGDPRDQRPPWIRNFPATLTGW